MIIKMHYGSIADMVAAHGYGPEKRDLLRAYEEWAARNEDPTYAAISFGDRG